MAVVPLSLQFRFVSVNSRSFLVSVPMNRETFFLPASNGPLAAF